MQQILFLCTGNYYRSRFAEEYFNYYAQIRALNYRADSKGLARDMVTTGNVGPMSLYAIAMLRSLRIPAVRRNRFPLSVYLADFEHVDKVILLSGREHQPMLTEHFGDKVDSAIVHAFDIEDVHIEPETTALPRLRDSLDRLLSALPEP
ncbi:MAG: low molecular weight phosphatase family protein [Pseudomonadota bacterium]